MRLIKKLLKIVGYIIAIHIGYFLIALLLSAITVNGDNTITSEDTHTIYLSTNGVHLDVVMPLESIDEKLLKGLTYQENEKYLSFGWGDENFYLNTPTWGDLTFGTAFKALFLKSATLMHVTRHQYKRTSWVAVPINTAELKELNGFILNSFHLDSIGNKKEIPNAGYHDNDHFYKAEGSYSFVKTCNSWVNKGFKESGLKASYWTPFDFGLLNKYK